MNAGLIVLAFFLGILSILILITVHEFGHFIVAKLAGAYVYEFSIGFGPRIYTHKGKETWFSIRIIPLGGFVSIASDRSDPPEGREEEAETVPDDRKMDYIARWKKALFIVAGPLMNFIVAIFLISTIFMATLVKANDMSFAGNKYDTNQIAYNLISESLSPEERSLYAKDSQNFSITGWEVILVKDSVTNEEINEIITDKQLESNENVKFKFTNISFNKESSISEELQNKLKKSFGKDYKKIVNGPGSLSAPSYTDIVYNFLNVFKNDTMKITSEDREQHFNTSLVRFSYRQMENLRSNKYKTINGKVVNDRQTKFSNVYKENKPVHKAEEFRLDGKNSSVGIMAPTRHFKNTTEAYGYSWKEMGNQSLAILKAFSLLFTGHIQQLAGPVGVANQTAQMVTAPDTFFLYFAGLSANLFVLNLIPIPPLDGYKFCENIIEAGLRREIKQRTKIWLYTAGAILFAVVFIVVTIKDFVIG